MRILLATIASLWLFSSALYAQLTVPFTAQEGYTAAAKLPTGVSNLSLHAATIFHANVTVLELGMNLSTGKSEAWVYLFQAKNNAGKDTTLVYLMTKTILGTFTPIPVPANIDLPDSLSLMPAITGSWLNSDALATKLNANTTVQEYRQKNPDSLYAQSAALVNTPLEQAYWIVTLTDEDSAPLTCITDASTGVVQCASLPTSVNESLYTSRQQGSVWPLPARDMVFLQLAPSLHNNNASLELFDTRGVKIRTFSHRLAAQIDEPVALSVEGLANGLYLLQYRSPEKTATFPVVISR